MSKFKVGDKFICSDCPEFGIGTITAIYWDCEAYDVYWEKVGTGDRYFNDDLIPEEIFTSPLYKVLSED